MPENKTKAHGGSVEAFIEAIPNEQRRRDSASLALIMESATGEPPVMWGSSIVGFGSHHYRYDSGREGDIATVSFAPRKDSLVIYGVVFYDEGRGLLDELGPHDVGKGCLYIKDLSKVDQAVLTRMVDNAYAAKSAE
jgi:hypothetical protein